MQLATIRLYLIMATLLATGQVAAHTHFDPPLAAGPTAIFAFRFPTEAGRPDNGSGSSLAWRGSVAAQ
jgi:hypothetical protein